MVHRVPPLVPEWELVRKTTIKRIIAALWYPHKAPVFRNAFIFYHRLYQMPSSLASIEQMCYYTARQGESCARPIKIGSSDMSQKLTRKRKRKTQRTITRAVTHIRLIEANPGKLKALDELMRAYL